MTDLEADILEREVPEIIIIDSKAKGVKYLFDSRKDRFAIAGKKRQSNADNKTSSRNIR